MFIYKILYPIITLMIVMLLVACDRYTTLLEQMDMAENLMNTKPDSALAILEDITVSNIKCKEIEARYALLKSMHWIRTTLTQRLSIFFNRLLITI